MRSGCNDIGNPTAEKTLLKRKHGGAKQLARGLACYGRDRNGLALAIRMSQVPNGDAEMQAFHSIVWKQGQSPFEREVSALTKLSEVIASAESRASQIRKNFPDRELDGFDVYDAIGRLVAIRKI